MFLEHSDANHAFCASIKCPISLTFYFILFYFLRFSIFHTAEQLRSVVTEFCNIQLIQKLPDFKLKYKIIYLFINILGIQYLYY